jgi:hypothetical protein
MAILLRVGTALADNNEHVPDGAADIPAVFFPHLYTGSRPKRCGEAADQMPTAAAAIRDYLGAHANHDKLADLEELADRLEQDSATLDEVDFPCMYG